MSGFLGQIRTTFNDTADNAMNYISTTYDKVSVDFGNSAAQIIPIVTGGMINPQPVNTTQQASSQTSPSNKQLVNQPIVEKKELEYLNPYEKQFESQYIGCYIDDPSEPSMNNFLGDISNLSECINLGKKNNYKYVGVQQGNKCFGSNGIPTTQQYDRMQNCNIGCDDINTGNCGGFYFNQVYKTTYDDIIPPISIVDNNAILDETNKKEAFGLLENFINSDSELDKINKLGNINNNCWTPINSYSLFFWMLILVILIYLLFEYLYKKKDSLLEKL